MATDTREPLPLTLTPTQRRRLTPRQQLEAQRTADDWLWRRLLATLPASMQAELPCATSPVTQALHRPSAGRAERQAGDA